MQPFSTPPLCINSSGESDPFIVINYHDCGLLIFDALSFHLLSFLLVFGQVEENQRDEFNLTLLGHSTPGNETLSTFTDNMKYFWCLWQLPWKSCSPLALIGLLIVPDNYLIF